MSPLAEYRQLGAVVLPVDTEPVTQFVIDNGNACCVFGICVERMHVNRLAIVRGRRIDCPERSAIDLGAVSGINALRGRE